MSLVISGPLSIFFLDRTNSELREIYNSLVFDVKIAYWKLTFLAPWGFLKPPVSSGECCRWGCSYESDAAWPTQISTEHSLKQATKEFHHSSSLAKNCLHHCMVNFFSHLLGKSWAFNEFSLTFLQGSAVSSASTLRLLLLLHLLHGRVFEL